MTISSNDILLKLDSLAYILLQKVSVYLQPLLHNLPGKLPNSVKLLRG